MSQVLELALDVLVPSPQNRPMEDIEGLAASLQDVGMIDPITIAADPDLEVGTYRILNGERRYTAAGTLGWEKVPCVMHEAESPVVATKVRLVANLHRKDFTPLQEARVFQELIDLGLSHRDIAATSGYSQPYVTKTLSLLKLPAEVQAALAEERITKSTALGITGLVKHKERMKTVLAALQGDSPVQQLERTVHDQLTAVTREKNAAARLKELTARAEQCRVDGLTEVDGSEPEGDDPDPLDGMVEVAEGDEQPGTVFTVDKRYDGEVISVTLWRPSTDEEAAAEAASPAQIAAAEAREADHAALTERKEFIVGILAPDVTLAGVQDFVLHAMVDWFDSDFGGSRYACEWLALDPPDDDEAPYAAALHALVEEGGEPAWRALLAMMLVASTDAFDDDPLGARSLAFLASNGYELPAVETEAAAEIVGEGGGSIREDDRGVGLSVPVAAPSPDDEASIESTGAAVTSTNDGGPAAVASAEQPAEEEPDTDGVMGDEKVLAESPGEKVVGLMRDLADTVGKPPWDHYDEHTVPDICSELDMPGCDGPIMLAVWDYENANGQRAAILSHCVHLLAGTSAGEFGKKALCSACQVRPPTFGSTVEGLTQCEECARIEDRRAELRHEFGTDPGPKRCEEIQRELDGLNVEQYQLEQGDFIDAAGAVHRGGDVTDEIEAPTGA